LTSTRASARQAIPDELRRDVRMLGERLGRVIKDYGGAGLLKDVETLRRSVIRARDDDEHERKTERIVAAWSLERAERVAQAFTCYFHLVNLAEEHHRARVLRGRAGPGAMPESLAATVPALRRRLGQRRLMEVLAGLEVHPVFTAHPTEARRRAVVAAIRRVGDQLDRIDDPRASETERRESMRRLTEEIDSLWRTGQLRTSQVTPLDEVRSTMAVFDQTLFRVVPEIYRALDWALGPADSGTRPPLASAFLRFGSWVGGDRDGHDAVTAKVTYEAMFIQAQHALLALEAATTRIGRSLTADASTTPPRADLRRRIDALRGADPQGWAELEKRSPSEPHRQFLLHVADRVRATRIRAQAVRNVDAGIAYACAADLVSDLRLVQGSLAAAGAPRQAFGELQHLIWQAQTFGFYLAELEVRQHSKVHAEALTAVRAKRKLSARSREVMDTLGTMALVQQRFGPDACRRYVVSFTRSVDDIAAVYELAEHATGGRPPVLDVIPLFETVDDLNAAPAVMEAMLKLAPVKSRLAATGRSLEVMLGYSDSTKEVGPLSATLALYQAQSELTAWAKRRHIRLTMFHGRGGALGRGGGPANRAVRAQAPGSVAGRFKVTEQGEVIFARYGNASIARRHLEQVASAVLEASTATARAEPARRFQSLAKEVDAAARGAYRALVESRGFAEWFEHVSPIEELSRMRIASRPTRRGGGKALEDLRAIPWVFAWSQMRLNLPGWYGLGSGLEAARLEDLRRAYASWPLFNALLDNAEMSLAKTDRRIASRYLALGDRPDLAARVLHEYDLTKKNVLAVTGHARLLEKHRVLSWAVELRNPYVDALSHLQLRALRALRAKGSSASHQARAERLFLLTVNGVAAGLQNTG
jgi:phosphoenolpyruvate carboxylase